MAKGTVYLYFKSKREILVALLEERIAELQSLIQAEVQAASSMAERLRGLVDAHRRFYTRNREFLAVLFTEVGQLGEALETRTRRTQETLVHTIESVLAAGVASRELRPIHAHMTALAFLGMLNTVGLAWLTGRLPDWGEERWEDVLDVFCHGVLPEPSPAGPPSPAG